MNRRTERDAYGNADIIDVDMVAMQGGLEFHEINLVTEALNTLAEYEETELTPKECATLKADNVRIRQGSITHATHQQLMESVERERDEAQREVVHLRRLLGGMKGVTAL